MRTEAAIPAEVLEAIRAPFAAEDAQRIDPPVIQPLNLFLDLAGEAMRARLFVVQAEGREEACLRPDLTIPVARACIAAGRPHGRHLYEGKAFRASPRGAEGHAEEFLQLGLEVYGDVDLEAEARIVGLAWRAAQAGGREDLSLRLGDAALFCAFVQAIGAPEAAAGRLQRAFGRKTAVELELARAGEQAGARSAGLARLLAGLPEGEASDLLDELWSLAGIQPVGGRPASEIVSRLVRRGHAAAEAGLSDDQADLVRRYLAISGEPRGALDAIDKLAASAGAEVGAALDAWSRRLDAIERAGAPLARASFTASFGRAFGYYDGLLFDVVSAALGEDRPVAGGGRYDTLMVRLGAANAPGAVGCMVRPVRAWKEAVE